jgi:hypothetical protein
VNGVVSPANSVKSKVTEISMRSTRRTAGLKSNARCAGTSAGNSRVNDVIRVIPRTVGKSLRT